MAPATLDKLRKQAKKLGVSAKEIRGADREELQTLIEQHSDNGGTSKSKSKARKAVKKAVAKKSSSAKKSAPARSRKSGTAKRQTARKSNGNSGYQAKGGRNVLDGVDFTEDEGWNPRPGSAPDRIIKALRKFKGNRQKTYEFLLSDIGDFVKSRKSDGSAWEKGEGPGSRRGMLKYRIARTAWQFALQTGQHEKAGNRVEYGTGGTGQGIFKPARKTRSTAAKAKTGRKATRTTAKAQRGSQRRTKGRKAARKR